MRIHDIVTFGKEAAFASPKKVALYMSYLRLMTFNVQLLPSVPFSASPGNEAESRAYAIGDAFDNLPDDERPDVVAFNEVFSEDGRDVLLSTLKPYYPHIIEKLDDCFIGQDSGLMIFSRYQFLPLPDTGSSSDPRVFFFSYPDDADKDSLACKGVGIVRIECPVGVVTIAFTHTQAYYQFEDQYRNERAAQMEDIGKSLSQVIGAPPNGQWGGAVVIGDLNIRGDTGATKGEWASVFAQAGLFFTDHLKDGWRSYNRPPNAPVEADPGYTNNNLEPGENGELPVGLLSRLDYQCFSTMPQRQLVPQHMRTRFRSLSDHWSLEADIHRVTPHCTPSDAIELATLPPMSSGMQVAFLNIQFPGSYQWVYVERAGTYTVFLPTPDLEMDLFLAEDMSRAWDPYDQTDKFAVGIQSVLDDVNEHGERLSYRGTQYDMPGPFFIRVRGGKIAPGFTGSCRVGVYRHTGETRETAIVIQPYAELKDPQLPEKKRLGEKDICWFRAEIDRAYSSKVHSSVFIVANATGNRVRAELLNPYNVSLSYASSPQTQLQLGYDTVGKETVYLTVRRESVNDTAIRVGWRSGLTYLRSVPNVRPMVLRCMDETGWDAMGGDEINLKLYADGMTYPFFSFYWDDADTHEILKLEGQVQEIAFVESVRVWVKEDDFIQDPADTTDVLALAQYDPPVKPVEQSFAVQSGTYRFDCTLTRTRQ